MDGEKPAVPTGKLEDALASMPAVMAALMRDYVEKKDVNARIEVRLRMKALLDFVGADTEYPPNPLLDKGPAPVAPVRDAIMGDNQAGGFQGMAGGAGGIGYFAQNPMVVPLPQVMNVPAARRIGVDNSDLLR